MHPPTLRTERLVLEPLAQGHSAGMFELWSSPEVCEHSGPATDWWGKALTLPAPAPETSDAIIDFFARKAAADDGCRWAIIETAGGTFVGAAGFNSLGVTAEIAWHQVPRCWGRGYMAEACAALVAWAGDAGIEQLVAFVDEANHRSARLAERLGFTPSTTARDGAIRWERPTTPP